MKQKSIKKLLTATLVATMLLGTTLTAAAETASGNDATTETPSDSTGSSSGSTTETPSDSTGSSSESTAPAVSGNENAPSASVSSNKSESAASTGTAASSSSAASTSSAAATVQYVSTSAPVSVAGKAVKSTVAGAVNVQKLQGVAVVTPLDQVVASLGLTGNQTPHIIVFDTDVKKSHLAMDCVNAAAESLGAEVVTAINVTLSAKENGKIVALSNGSAGMVVGLPKNADKSKTYSVVCVQPGGVVTILKDQDDSDATVTFEIKAGLGTYAVVAK